MTQANLRSFFVLEDWQDHFLADSDVLLILLGTCAMNMNTISLPLAACVSENTCSSIYLSRANCWQVDIVLPHLMFTHLVRLHTLYWYSFTGKSRYFQVLFQTNVFLPSWMIFVSLSIDPRFLLLLFVVSIWLKHSVYGFSSLPLYTILKCNTDANKAVLIQDNTVQWKSLANLTGVVSFGDASYEHSSCPAILKGTVNSDTNQYAMMVLIK